MSVHPCYGTYAYDDRQSRLDAVGSQSVGL